MEVNSLPSSPLPALPVPFAPPSKGFVSSASIESVLNDDEEPELELELEFVLLLARGDAGETPGPPAGDFA